RRSHQHRRRRHGSRVVGGRRLADPELHPLFLELELSDLLLLEHLEDLLKLLEVQWVSFRLAAASKGAEDRYYSSPLDALSTKRPFRARSPAFKRIPSRARARPGGAQSARGPRGPRDRGRRTGSIPE